MSHITSQQMGGVQIQNSKQVEPILPTQRVGILMGQGKGFKETWGYTNPCAGRPKKTDQETSQWQCGCQLILLCSAARLGRSCRSCTSINVHASMSLVHWWVLFASVLTLLLGLVVVFMFVLAIDVDMGCWLSKICMGLCCRRVWANIAPSRYQCECREWGEHWHHGGVACFVGCVSGQHMSWCIFDFRGGSRWREMNHSQFISPRTSRVSQTMGLPSHFLSAPKPICGCTPTRNPSTST